MNELTGVETGSDKSAYRVLARKYRPADFDDLIGHSAMVQTLTNAFASGRIAHAYMLTGVRGVGKTTTARILARALNYRTEEIDLPTVDISVPGDHCREIMEGRHVDVVEMDAASHTGIDNIRELIEQIRYRPVSARYKVYIIDEVHMLSTAAFNGLLKTLEEPPEHVKFIFATTEIRKVPITVLSRCQRFDLQRVDAALLVEHLRHIADQEKVSVEDDALAMIARAAEGSVRDALSLLDQAIAHGGETIEAETMRSMLGLADRARIVDLFDLLMQGDMPGTLALFKDLYDHGAQPVAVLADLAELTHLVTRLHFVPKAIEDPSLSQTERERGADLAGRLAVTTLSRTWQMLLKAITETEQSGQPAAAAEMALIRLAHAASLPAPEEALSAIAAEGAASPGASGQGGQRNGSPQSAISSAPPQAAGSTTSAAASTAPQMRVVEMEDRAEDEARPPVTETAQESEAPGVSTSVELSDLAGLMKLAEENRDLAFKVSIRQFVRLVSMAPGRLEVNLVEGAPPSLLGDISRKLKDWTGVRWIVSLSREAGLPTLQESERADRDTLLADARSDPAVAEILDRFPGARIVDVRLASSDQDEPLPDDGEPDTDTEDDSR